jgi:hypothetical protein
LLAGSARTVTATVSNRLESAWLVAATWQVVASVGAE